MNSWPITRRREIIMMIREISRGEGMHRSPVKCAPDKHFHFFLCRETNNIYFSNISTRQENERVCVVRTWSFCVITLLSALDKYKPRWLYSLLIPLAEYYKGSIAAGGRMAPVLAGIDRVNNTQPLHSDPFVAWMIEYCIPRTEYIKPGWHNASLLHEICQ